MAGLVSICVGKRKTGKTTFSKKMLDLKPKNYPCVVYDVNNEYKDYYSEPFIDFLPFMDKIVNLKYHYILIEEATIFFNPRARVEEMINLLVRARHTQNIIQLNFHSWASVPSNIKDLVDYIHIFKTNDNEEKVRQKVDRNYIVNTWIEVQKSTNPFEFKTIRME